MADTIANPTASMSKALGNAAQLHRALEEAGLSPEARQRVVDDPDFRLKLVRFWMGDATAASTTSAEAAQIMGSGYHGPEDVELTFWLKFTQKQRKLLEVVPFSPEVLRACSKTHVLVAGYPLSIMDMHRKMNKVFSDRDTPWYSLADERFAITTKVTMGWHLVRKSELPGSTSQSWDVQQAMVKGTASHAIPRACLVVFAMVVHFMVTGERIIQPVWVDTNDTTARGYRVYLTFTPGGVCIRDWHSWPGDLGVAVSHKPS